MKVVLEMDDWQYRAVRQALDLYARLLAGQVSAVDDVLRSHVDAPPSSSLSHDALRRFKQLWFPQYPYEGNMGIKHLLLPEDARIAYEVAGMLDHAVAWHRNPEGGEGVNFREPLKVSSSPLPKVTVTAEPEDKQ